MVGDAVAAMQELGFPPPTPKSEKRDVRDRKRVGNDPGLTPHDLFVACFLIAVVIQQSAEGRITNAILTGFQVTRNVIPDVRI
jgi:hypothetical protein